MVLYITMNGDSRTCGRSNAFALMYRRANETFYDGISLYAFIRNPITPFSVIPAEPEIQLLRAVPQRPETGDPAPAKSGTQVFQCSMSNVKCPMLNVRCSTLRFKMNRSIYAS